MQTKSISPTAFEDRIRLDEGRDEFIRIHGDLAHQDPNQSVEHRAARVAWYRNWAQHLLSQAERARFAPETRRTILTTVCYYEHLAESLENDEH